MRIVEQSVKLRWVTPEAERSLEDAGRTAHKSADRITEGSAGPFLTKILSFRPPHTGVIEHASASFRIVCDRGISHELVRHRWASYLQESTRYCNYGKSGEVAVIEPPGLSEKTRSEWVEACKSAERSYLWMVEFGSPPEIARSVLPTCLKTEIVMTCDFQEWRHFLKLRLSPKAHPQMQAIARMIWVELRALSPACFEEFVSED